MCLVAICRLRHKELSQSELRELDFKVSRGSQDARDDSRAENAIEVWTHRLHRPKPVLWTPCPELLLALRMHRAPF